MTYHQQMLADPHRMTAYERAIRKLVKPGHVVLDVGSGTGVLACLAARAGAKVHAVESQDVAHLAVTLAERNHLIDRITFHHADIRELAVREPVDLIISDFMGRFVFDDRMHQAMAAALKWLKPQGKICPESLDLFLAPVHLGHFAPLDTGCEPLLGLDFRPLSSQASQEPFGTQVEPDMLLAEPQHFAHLQVSKALEPLYRKNCHFPVVKQGRCRGVVGWFRATLTQDVNLTTEPGVETHWGQMLFPSSPMVVEPGDMISFELSIAPDKPNSQWRWSVTGPAEPSDGPAVPDLSDGADPAEVSNATGIRHFEAGDFAAAAEQFQIAISTLDIKDNQRACELYENLGLAYLNAGNHVPAVMAFLRSLEGRPTSREQALRFLVDACFHSHRLIDGRRFLAQYEQAFGVHPSGWSTASVQDSE